MYGLIGKTLVHSFSKNFFTEKFKREGIDDKYELFELPEIEQFRDLVDNVPLNGLNVTIPYKEQVMQFLDEIDETAKAINAVNTVKFMRKADGSLFLKGYNTDVIGFTESLRPLLKNYHTHALVLGTGGAAKAVAYALGKFGIDYKFVSREKRGDNFTYGELDEKILQKYLLIVNCSPLGTFPNVDAAPDIPYQFLGAEHLLYDLVYNPEKTLFMKKGEAQGAVVKNGLEMLHGQALAAWDIWQR
jgi:shikimate dehydrogenase